MSESKPLVELSDTGEPAVLDYNVPEPTSYTGRNLIELAYDAGIFEHLPGTKVTLDPDALTPTSLQTFLADRAILAQTTLSTISRRPPMPPPSPRRTTQATPVLAATSDLDVLEAKLNLEHDRYPVLSSTQSGGVQILYAPAFDAPVPGIYLVETYRLSNFLGNYGAGKTIKTFSLLPGEKTSISITSYKNTSSTATSASSIFDSYTEETADDFESAIQSENTATESKDKTTSWNVEAEASGNWGVASVSVSGGASGTTNTAREDFASSVNSATEKHANTASAQRDVEINTNTEETTETGEETAIEREIENINVSRTLNFVFRQMNQEHVSILHLVDVKVAFWNGYPETRMEVPLYDLDRLLEYCVTLPADRDRVRRDVMFAVQEIRDWRGDTHFDAGSPASPDNSCRSSATASATAARAATRRSTGRRRPPTRTSPSRPDPRGQDQRTADRRHHRGSRAGRGRGARRLLAEAAGREDRGEGAGQSRPRPRQREGRARARRRPHRRRGAGRGVPHRVRRAAGARGASARAA